MRLGRGSWLRCVGDVRAAKFAAARSEVRAIRRCLEIDDADGVPYQARYGGGKKHERCIYGHLNFAHLRDTSVQSCLALNECALEILVRHYTGE